MASDDEELLEPHEAIPERVEVGRLSRADLDAAVAVLSRAFQRGVTYRTVLAHLSTGELDAALRRIKRAAVRAALRDGEVLGAWCGSRLVGVALVLPPGCRWSLAGRARLALGVLQWRMLPALNDLARIDRWTQERHTRERHYYLYFVGIDPQAQGRGVGRTLLDRIFSSADRDGAPVWLETASDELVPYYQRYGFQVVDDERVPGVALRMRTMRRAPGACS